MFWNPSYERPAPFILPTPSHSTSTRKYKSENSGPAQVKSCLQREAHSSSWVYIWNSWIPRNPPFVLVCISEDDCWGTGSPPCSCRWSAQGTLTVLGLHHLISLSEVTDTSEKLPTALQHSILEGTKAKCLLCSHWYLFTQNVWLKSRGVKKSPRKHFQKEIFLVSLSKTYSSSVLLKCVYSIAR